MTTPLVSIIIPCYNGEEYVGEAIQSALDQTYPNFEVIVIDDGSTDGTLDVIRSFGDAIRWETGPNRGACAARNRGIELARGELIQFLDADDLLYPQKLARQVPLVVAKVADIVVCDWVGYRVEAPHRSYVRSGAFDGSDPVIRALRKDIHTPAPVLWKEQLMKIGGFREELLIAQDTDLYLRLACTGVSFYHLPEVLYTVRTVPNSVSGNLVQQTIHRRQVYWQAYEVLRESGKLTDERAREFAAAMVRTARLYLRLGMKAKGHELLADARKMHPSGGIGLAYGRFSRVVENLIGPFLTEQLIIMASWPRRCLSQSDMAYRVYWAIHGCRKRSRRSNTGNILDEKHS